MGYRVKRWKSTTAQLFTENKATVLNLLCDPAVYSNTTRESSCIVNTWEAIKILQVVSLSLWLSWPLTVKIVLDPFLLSTLGWGKPTHEYEKEPKSKWARMRSVVLIIPKCQQEINSASGWQEKRRISGNRFGHGSLERMCVSGLRLGSCDGLLLGGKPGLRGDDT